MWELSEKKKQTKQKTILWVSECVDVCVCAESLPDSHEMPRASHVYNLTC